MSSMAKNTWPSNKISKMKTWKISSMTSLYQILGKLFKVDLKDLDRVLENLSKQGKSIENDQKCLKTD